MNRIFYFTTILAIATSLIITGCAGDNKTATGQQAQPAISQAGDTDDAATAQQQTSSQSAADVPAIEDKCPPAGKPPMPISLSEKREFLIGERGLRVRSRTRPRNPC